MKMRFLLIATLGCALFSCINGNDSATNSSEENSVSAATDTLQTPEQVVDSTKAVYAISNKYGTKFLVKTYGNDGDSAALKTISYAIFDSKLYKIKFAGKQMGDEEKSNGRDTWINFDNLEGFVFENSENAIIAKPKNKYEAIWEPVFLCNEPFLNENTLVPFKSTKNKPDQQLLATFEAKYERKIKEAKISFVFGENGEHKFCSMQFKNVGNQALGVYAICTEEGIFYLDFPETITEHNEFSLWRVDDGGDFYLENTPVVIFKNHEGYLFKMQDIGFEGYNCYTISLKEGKIEKHERDYSAYTAPM